MTRFRAIFTLDPSTNYELLVRSVEMRLMNRIIIPDSMRLLVDSSILTRRLILDLYFIQFPQFLLTND
jgi:hypothetical protein